MAAKKILIVDDSSTSLMTSQMMLKKLKDVTIVSARNGEEGVRMAVQHVPDLILMDVVMPVMNGLDATKKIREDPATRHIPIIMVTTRAELEFVETGFKNGCSDYVTKPIDSVVLRTKVESLLGH